MAQLNLHFHEGDYVRMPHMSSPLSDGRSLDVSAAARYTKFISDFITAPLLVDGEATGAELTVFGSKPNKWRPDGVGVQLRVPINAEQAAQASFYDTSYDLCRPDDYHLELTVRRDRPDAAVQLDGFMQEFAPVPLRNSAGAVLCFANMMAFYLND